MDVSKYKQGLSPGSLVKAEFLSHRIVGGIPESHYIEGWSFVPRHLGGVVDLESSLASLVAPLEMTMAELGRLDGFFQQAPGGFNVNPWVLYQPLRLREARLSSRIENTVASAREVAGLPYLSTQRIEALEVRNYLNAIELGAKAIGPGEDERRQITESLIRQLHQSLLRDIPGADRKRPGNYRDRLVYIGDEHLGFERARFVPPPASEVPHLMRELVGFIRRPPEGLPALLAVGMAHYQFETIHPFADGNGRLGRMLITLGLCDRGVLSAPLIYPSGYIDANKREYYDSLLAVSTHGDWGRWLRFFLEAVRSQAVDTLARMKELLRLREDIRSRVAHRSLSARFLSTIDHLFAEPVITAASLNRAVGGGAQTSRNYIDILCYLNVLKEITGKKKGRAYMAWEIIRIADQD